MDRDERGKVPYHMWSEVLQEEGCSGNPLGLMLWGTLNRVKREAGEPPPATYDPAELCIRKVAASTDDTAGQPEDPGSS